MKLRDMAAWEKTYYTQLKGRKLHQTQERMVPYF